MIKSKSNEPSTAGTGSQLGPGSFYLAAYDHGKHSIFAANLPCWPHGVMVKFSRIMMVIACVVLATSVLAGAWIHLSYCDKLPSTPDERVGRTYRMTVNHGFVRYGSERELLVLKSTETFLGIAGMLFAMAVLLRVAYGKVRPEESHKP